MLCPMTDTVRGVPLQWKTRRHPWQEGCSWRWIERPRCWCRHEDVDAETNTNKDTDAGTGADAGTHERTRNMRRTSNNGSRHRFLDLVIVGKTDTQILRCVLRELEACYVCPLFLSAEDWCCQIFPCNPTTHSRDWRVLPRRLLE